MPPNQGPRKWPTNCGLAKRFVVTLRKGAWTHTLESKQQARYLQVRLLEWVAEPSQTRLRPTFALLEKCFAALRKFHLPKQTFCKVQLARYWGAGPIITRDQPSPHPELIVSCLESRVSISCFNIQGPIRFQFARTWPSCMENYGC